MFEIRNLKVKKAYILLNTVFIVSICLLILALFTKLVIDEKTYLFYFQNYTLKTQNDKMYNEYLFTSLNEFIKGNMSCKAEDIRNYFVNFGNGTIVSFNKSLIKYDKAKDSFILVYQYEEGILKSNEYKYEVMKDNIKYIFTNSTYGSGRL